MSTGKPGDACTPGDDSNCNGTPNEGCVCKNDETRPCGTDTGNCSKGIQKCSSGVWGSCTGGVQPVNSPNDGCAADDDANCNGTPNEGCNCVNGDQANCGKETGDCSFGKMTCSDGQFGPCVGGVKPKDADTCDAGNDATCNGTPNEGCACLNGDQDNCGTDKGECSFGKMTCSQGSFGPCVGGVTPKGADTCDAGNDATCDGKVNDGCVCINGNTKWCGSDVGGCEQALQTCGSGQWSACNDVGPKNDDACSYGDDATCNGTPNEGCECIYGEVDDCGDCGTRYCNEDGWSTCYESNLCHHFVPSNWSSPYGPNEFIDEGFQSPCPGQPWHISFDYDFGPNGDHGAFQRNYDEAVGGADDITHDFYGQGSASFDVVGRTHWAIFSDANDHGAGFTNINAHCNGWEGDPGIYFAPPWQQPYENIPVNGVDAAFDPKCPGAWTLTFNYDFEEGDHGAMLQNSDGTLRYYYKDNNGYDSLTVTGSTHWALWAPSGTSRRGFYNVRAECN